MKPKLIVVSFLLSVSLFHAYASSAAIMRYSSTSLIQTVLPVGIGDVNQRIIAVKVVTTGSSSPIKLTALKCKMTGTTNLYDVTNIKVYYT